MSAGGAPVVRTAATQPRPQRAEEGVALTILRWAVGILLAGLAAWSIVHPAPRPSPPPSRSEAPPEVQRRAAEFLGAATWEYQGGELGLALELVGQALELWPDYREASRFLVDVAPRATATAAAAPGRR